MIIIPLETPSKKNSRITLKNGRTIPNKKYSEWHKKACLFIDKSLKFEEKPLKIEVHFVHGDLRKRDSDNGLSSILDLLKDCKIIPDDNWMIIQSIKVSNSYEKNNPKAIIGIEYV